MSKYSFILFICLQMLALRGWAASCCGGQAALPDLITGEEKFRLSAAVQGSRVIGDAPAEGVPVFRQQENRSEFGALTLSTGVQVSEKWQMAARSQVFEQRRMGDTDVIAGYTLSERDSVVDSWPKLVLLATLTVPTGKSVYERLSNNEVPTGRGFYRTGLGIFGFSTYQRWDFSLLTRVAHGFTRRFADYYVEPGFVFDSAAAAGYAITSAWRVGTILQGVIEESLRVTNNGNTSTSSGRMVWPVTTQISHFWDMHNTITMSYMDETLIGPVRSTELIRSVVINYGYRY